MNKVEIGNAAGEVWRLLEKEGDHSITEIQKKLKLSKEMLYLAVGWLYREDKIHCTSGEKGKYTCTKNIPSSYFG